MKDSNHARFRLVRDYQPLIVLNAHVTQTYSILKGVPVGGDSASGRVNWTSDTFAVSQLLYTVSVTRWRLTIITLDVLSNCDFQVSLAISNGLSVIAVHAIIFLPHVYTILVRGRMWLFVFAEYPSLKLYIILTCLFILHFKFHRQQHDV